MRLTIISHKLCWGDGDRAPGSFATDGGFPFQVAALSELFDETQLAVPVASSPRPGGTRIRGHNLTVVPLSEVPGRGALRKITLLPWYLRTRRSILSAIDRADVVHTPVPSDVGSLAMMVARARGKRLLVRYCGDWNSPRTIAQKTLRRFMECTAGPQALMLATGGGDHQPSQRNPRVEWIFSSSLSVDQVEASARVRHLAGAGKRRIIIVGRQEATKGTDILVRALAQLTPHVPDLHLDVVGEGSHLPATRKLAESLGISDRVEFHGRVRHEAVLALLARADLFCLPSAGEGFSKAILEALASGLPVVVARAATIPSLIQGAGVVVEDRNPSAFAGAIESCLSRPDTYTAMSARAVGVARGLTLEAWGEEIGRRMSDLWGHTRQQVSAA